MRRLQSAFTLVEVMVAIFVMTVGLLGIAALQITSKQTNFEALERMTASELTQDLLERARANPGQLGVYTNNGQGRTLTPNPATVTVSAPACDMVGANCLPFQIAQFDLAEFTDAVAGIAEVLAAKPGGAGAQYTGGLVAPTVCVQGASIAPGLLTVAVAWRGSVPLSNPATHDCGAGSGLYDAPNGGADAYRRVLVVDTYIE